MERAGGHIRFQSEKTKRSEEKKRMTPINEGRGHVGEMACGVSN